MEGLLEQGIIAAFNNKLDAKYLVENDSKSDSMPLSVHHIFSHFYNYVTDDKDPVPNRHEANSLRGESSLRDEKARNIVYTNRPKTGMCIFINTTSGKTKLNVEPSDTIGVVKAMFWEKEGIPPNDCRLMFLGKMLYNDHTLSDYNITKDCILHVLRRQIGGGGCAFYHVDKNFFAPQFNFDFRKKKTDENAFTRGNFSYFRPLGSKRYAIKVLGQYPEGDKWLGKDGIRTESESSEWPVAYHGTKETNARGILKEGFDLKKGVRFAYGNGIYCTPDPKVALAYAVTYEYQGKRYKIIIQTRVDPTKLRVIKDVQVIDGGNSLIGDYWLLPDGNAIRPYGICVYDA